MISKIITTIFILLGLFLLVYFSWSVYSENSPLERVSRGVKNASAVLFKKNADRASEKTTPAKTEKTSGLHKKTEANINVAKTETTSKTDKTPAVEPKELYNFKTGLTFKYSANDETLLAYLNCARKLTKAERSKLEKEIVNYIKQYLKTLSTSEITKLFVKQENYSRWQNMGKFLTVTLKFADGSPDDSIYTSLD